MQRTYWSNEMQGRAIVRNRSLRLARRIKSLIDDPRTYTTRVESIRGYIAEGYADLLIYDIRETDERRAAWIREALQQKLQHAVERARAAHHRWLIYRRRNRDERATWES